MNLWKEGKGSKEDAGTGEGLVEAKWQRWERTRETEKEEKSGQGPRRSLAEAEVKATCVALLLTHALPSWRPGSRIKADGREQVSSRAGGGLPVSELLSSVSPSVPAEIRSLLRGCLKYHAPCSQPHGLSPPSSLCPLYTYSLYWSPRRHLASLLMCLKSHGL